LDWATTLREFKDSEVISLIAETQTSINARFEVVTQLGGQQMGNAQAGPPQWAAPPAGGFTAPPAAAPAGPPDNNPHYCNHGMRAWKSGVSSKGNAYAAWYCPSNDRNGQCPPEYPPRG
jgi:hypothetical protein